MSRTTIFIIPMLLIGLVACGRKAASETAASSTESRSDRVVFEDARGAKLFTIKDKPDGAKVVQDKDGAETELWRLHWRGADLEVQNSSDQTLGRLDVKDKKVEILDAAKATLFVLKQQDDGDWKVEDGGDRLLYRLKKRDNGIDIEKGDGTAFRKVRVYDKKVKLKEENGTELLVVRSAVKPLALASHALDGIDRHAQAALFVLWNRKP